jgi:hypothetical protein
MDKQSLLDALATLPAEAVKRTKTGRIREMLPEIEAAQAAGYSNDAIAQALTKQGVEVTKKVLETTLYRVRKERGLCNPQSYGLHNPQKNNTANNANTFQDANIANSHGIGKIEKGEPDEGNRKAIRTPAELRKSLRSNDIDLDSFLNNGE